MRMKNIGIVGTIISGLLLLFGIYKYSNSISMYKASGYLTRIWKDRADDFKIMIIICAVVLLISLIVLIASLMKGEKVNIASVPNTTQSKLQELEQIYKDNLITQEEYENKRKEIIDKL